MSENKTANNKSAVKSKPVKAAAAVKSAPAVKSAKGAKAAENSSGSSVLNALLWLAAIVLVGGAVVGNWYYTSRVVIDESSFDRFIRVAIVIAVIAVGLGVTLFTTKGRALLNFGREAYVELRKVVWPTRQEALQTTFIVFIAVCVVSLFLYLCDIVFLQLVRYITI